MLATFDFKKAFGINLCLLLLFVLLVQIGLAKTGQFFAIAFFIFNSWLLGVKLLKGSSYLAQQLLGFLLLSLAFSLIGSAFFYSSKLQPNLWPALLALTGIIMPMLCVKRPALLELKFIKLKFNLWLIALNGLYLFLMFLAFSQVIFASTSQSLRTPWEIIYGQIFVLYFVGTFALLLIIKLSSNAWPLFLIIIHAFFTLSVAFFVYQIGFGYDPFIHRTNLNLIAQTGTLLPKPFYYIGQYSLLLFYNFLFKLPLDLLDKILVPLATAIYLPTAVYCALKDNFKTKNNLLLLCVVSVLAFPLASFIVTTPAGLAGFLAIIAILFSLYYIRHEKTSGWPLAILALSALSVHPLVGLPLSFFVVLVLFYHKWQIKNKLPAILRQSILWEVIVLGCLALPVAFLINSLTLSELKVGLQAGWFKELINNLFDGGLNFYWRRFVSLPDLAYVYGFNLAWIVLGLALLGLGLIAIKKQLKGYAIFLFGALMAIANYALLKAMVNFFSLQSHEQATYPKRVLELTAYMLSPFILIGLYLLWQKVLEKQKIIQLAAILLASAAITFAFYFAYPRVDKIAESHGYSTSVTDLETVNLLEKLQNKNGFEPYVVLASQPVSAGAIKELGYKYYYNDYFFYPVPTGGKLYQLYEDLAYGKKPTSEIIGTVKYLTGVNTVYFVINDYWFDAHSKIEAEKETAGEWFAINGKNYIFKH